MKRLTYTGRLRFPYGFHSGDGRRLGAVDQPLFREPDGALALAGSSLAGVLRSDLTRLARASGRPEGRCEGGAGCDCIVCRLLGPRPSGRRSRAGEEEPLRASKLHVAGGHALGKPGTRVRDRVGIDRKTRTAADQRKYDVEVVEPGVEFPFTLRLDEPADDERLYLEAVLRRLADGWLFVGGKTASGLGRAEGVELLRHELDLGDPEQLIAHLLADDPLAGGTSARLFAEPSGTAPRPWPLAPSTSEAAGEEAQAPEPGWGQLRLRLEIDLPWGLLVNDPAEALATGFDHGFARVGDGRPVLPGSALRGALRSRAEQILRTLGGQPAACDLHTRNASCHERLREEAKARGEALAPGEERSRHCPACLVFGSGRLASPVRVTDFHPTSPSRGEPLRHEQVAVDRLTGGAAAGAKFNSQASPPVTVVGEIHLEIGRHRLAPWGLGLLALTLRDLLWGDVPLGFGSGKGLNEATARLLAVDRFWLEPPEALAGLDLPGGAGAATWRPPERAASPREAVGPVLAARMEGWVEALHQYLAGEDAGQGERP